MNREKMVMALGMYANIFIYSAQRNTKIRKKSDNKA